MSMLKLFEEFDLISNMQTVHTQYFYNFMDEYDEMVRTYMEVGELTDQDQKEI